MHIKHSLDFTFTLTPRSYAQMLRFHYSLHKRYFYLRLAAVLAALYIIYVELFSLRWEVAAGMLALITLLMLTLRPKLTKWILQRRFGKLPLLHGERTVTFDAEDFRVTTRMCESTIHYDAITKVRYNDRFILLYLDKRHFHFVLLDGVKREKADALIALLKGRIEDTKGTIDA